VFLFQNVLPFQNVCPFQKVFLFKKCFKKPRDLLWQIRRNNCFNGKNDSTLSDFNSVELKKTQKIIKGQIFFEGQRPKISNFMIFSGIWVSLQTIVPKKSLV
jgi:hypothetical protein